MDEVLESVMSSDSIQEYLIFTVDSIEFGIEIALVQEIIKIQPVSAIPNALPFCRGIINIRGTIVPVIDMRIKLGFEPAEYNERTCIVVVMLETELIGVIVDMVQDVVRISEQDLSDSPAIGSSGHKSYTAKIASIDEKIIQILDVNSVFDIGIG